MVYKQRKGYQKNPYRYDDESETSTQPESHFTLPRLSVKTKGQLVMTYTQTRAIKSANNSYKWGMS